MTLSGGRRALTGESDAQCGTIEREDGTVGVAQYRITLQVCVAVVNHPELHSHAKRLIHHSYNYFFGVPLKGV